MKRTVTLLLFALIVLQSCSPKIRTSLSNTEFKPLDDVNGIVILKHYDKLPEDSSFVGDLKIGDSGFSTDCGYTKVIDDAKETAKQSGANIIQLTELKQPDFHSTCYRIKAKLYRNSNSDALAQLSETSKLGNKSRLPANSDYAVVYFYRPKIFAGSMIGFKVRMDDETVIGRVRNGEKFEYKITEFGKHEFWGKTESKTSVTIDIEKGQEYFVRCGINLGITVGRPEMYVVENALGISEYESQVAKNNKKGSKMP